MASFTGTSAADTITGTVGDDLILGLQGADTLDGGDGADSIYSGGGGDTVYGGNGNDQIFLTTEYDPFFNYYATTRVFGGGGDDFVQVSSLTETVQINLGAGNDRIVFDDLTGAVSLTLGTGIDTISFGPNIMLSGSPDVGLFIADFTTGAGGDIFDISTIFTRYDDLWNGSTNPFAAGLFTLQQVGTATFLNFHYYAPDLSYFLTVARFTGRTVASFTAANFAGFDPGGAVTPGMTVVGTAANESIAGSLGNDALRGGAGDDIVTGLAGIDTLRGDAGMDSIDGGYGNDNLYGDAGNDTLLGGGNNDTLRGGLDDDILDGGTGNDTLLGEAGNDRLIDERGNDTLDGGDGNDVISSVGSGVDSIIGGLGDDVVMFSRLSPSFSGAVPVGEVSSISTGDGADFVDVHIEYDARVTVNLGAGDDAIHISSNARGSTVTLGTGRDRVVLAPPLQFSSFFPAEVVTVTDFTAGANGDVLDMTAFFPGMNSAGNPIATGFMRLVQDGADTLVQFDFDGNQTQYAPETVMRLTGVTASSLVTANLAGIAPSGAALVATTLTGTAANERLYGTMARDTISGLDGNDTLYGQNGNDSVNGGNGDDVLSGGTGNDTLDGGIGNDTLDGGLGFDVLRGGDGHDVISDVGQIFGTEAAYLSRIDGGAGDDVITAQYSIFTLALLGQSAEILGGSGSDQVTFRFFPNQSTNAPLTSAVIDLGTGDDRLTLNYIAVSLSVTTGTGSDIIDLSQFPAMAQNIQSGARLLVTDFTTGPGGDRISGLGTVYDFIAPTHQVNNPFAGQFYLKLEQHGADTWLVVGDVPQYAGAVLMVFANTVASSFTAENLGFDPFAAEPPGVVRTGTALADTLYGDFTDDTLSGLAGNDRLEGLAGNDVLDGGDGDDEVYGAAGNDSVTGGAGNDFIAGGAGADVVTGGDGDDIINVQDTLDSVDGGAGMDSLVFNNPLLQSAAISIDLSRFEGEQIVIFGGQIFTSIEQVDLGFLTGTAFDDRFILTGSFNQFFGGQLGGGNDVLEGADVGESVFGDTGDDMIAGNGGSDSLSGGAGDDVLDGGADNDTLDGGSGNDSLIGGAGLDTLLGGYGNDVLSGGADDDQLVAASGIDSVNGGDGNDFIQLNGSAGDVITGGAGLDRVFFTAQMEDIPTGSVAVAGLDLDLTSFALNGTIASGGGTLSMTGVEEFLFALSFLNDRLILGDAWLPAEVMNGELGDDTLIGGAANDNITGGEGNDILGGGLGNDFLSGGNGDDIFLFGVSNGDDTLFGGDGINTAQAGVNGAQMDMADITGSNSSITRLASAGFANARLFSSVANVIDISGFSVSGLFTVDGEGGDDTLTGSSIADILLGGDGNDILDGRGGVDTLRGGTGDDFYILDTTLDAISEDAGAGTDTVQSVRNYTLLANFENLMLTGTARIGMGNTLANALTGNASVNELSGLSGNDSLSGLGGADILDGGTGNDRLDGGAGGDRMTGGLGNDSFVVDSAADIITELAGEGTDTVETTLASYTLAATLENLRYVGAANFTGNGNDAINILTGGNGADRLFGGLGNDQLNGGDGNDILEGGVGNDRMTGGAGNDSYYVEVAGDTTIEAANGGFDTVFAPITWTLAVNVEFGTLVGTANINLTGNASNNGLAGNSGNNILNGGAGNDTLNGFDGDDRLDGGTGLDTMAGGNGNDLYIVDQTGDVVTEVAGGGTDRVESTAAFTLSAQVENLTLTGTAAINGTGNDLANIIIGNGGSNVLSGAAGNDSLSGGAGNDLLDGGLGDDALAGGTGNDGYVIDSSGDTITEAASADVDIVYSSIDYTLGSTLENLALIGTGAINGTGNAAANVMQGNGAANTLLGLAGDDLIDGGDGADVVDGGAGNDALTGNAGNDVLIGGAGQDIVFGDAGADTFRFNLAELAGLTAATADVIGDFVRTEGDRIDLSLIDASVALAGNQSFAFIGAAAFGGIAGQLRYSVSGTDVLIQGDTNGDRVADFAILIGDTANLLAGDFIL